MISLIYILYAGTEFSSGRRSHNKTFSIMHKLNGRRSRQFWQSNWVVAFEADVLTLLQDSVCPILQVVSSIPSCKIVEETCLRKFSTHFDYYTTASIDFIFLDQTTFSNIIQVGVHFPRGSLIDFPGIKLICFLKEIITVTNYFKSVEITSY